MENLESSYINFLQNIGDLDIESINEYVSKNVLPNVNKVINNELVCQNSQELSQQLIDVRKMAGKMHINLVNHCSDEKNNQCAVRYILESEQAGNFSTLAIIDFDEAGKIKKIDEIYTQLSDTK